MSEKHYNGNQGRGGQEEGDTLMTPANPLTPQGALALALPVGPGVVQSLAYHPMEPCLLTAMGGSIQCWREETYEAEGAPG